MRFTETFLVVDGHVAEGKLPPTRPCETSTPGNYDEMAESAVLFDIDGTLVDSNYLHIHAWQRAFDEVGLDVEAWRIHQRIGMDGSTLLDEVAPSAGSDAKERLSDLHTRFYLQTADLIRPLRGARRLLDAVAATGLQVILATSAPEEELVVLRKVLGRDDIVSAVTTSEDVETAKPDPGIVETALARGGIGPDQAVFVGDSVWDIRAASRAGVQCIGLQSGGLDRLRLEAEGAVAVFENPEDLLGHLPESAIGRLAEGVRQRV